MLVAFLGASQYVLRNNSTGLTRLNASQLKPDVFQATTVRHGGRTSGPAAKPSQTGKEVVADRSRNSRTFMRGANYETVLYPGSINYQDSKGHWQPIDDTLVPSKTPGFAAQNKANGYSVLLPGSLSSPIRFSLPNGTIEFGLSGSGGALATSGSTATYASAFSGATVSYTAQSDSLKEAISLASPQAPTSFTYRLTLPSGWLARSTAQGGVDVLDAKGNPEATFRTPFMYDASHTTSGYSSAVSMTLTGSAGNQSISMVADKNWINATGRVFPVVIDPTIDTNVNYYDPHDCYIQNTNPNGSFCSSQATTTLTTNPLGFDGTTVNRNLYWFGVSTSRYSIPVPNSNILDAELDFTLSSSTSSSAVPVTVYPITQAWDDAGASWNNANTGVPWTTPGGTVGSAITTVNVGPTAGSFAIYNLTSTVQSWVNGNATDNGFLLRASNESTNALLQINNDNFGTSDTDPGRPHLRVQWNGWGGLQPWYNFNTKQVDDRMQLAVNIANGQLVVHNHDLAVHGVGQDLGIDRYYNSLSDIQWHLGNGWNLNAGCDVRIDLDDHDGVAYWAPDGYEVLFRSNGSGGYTTPPGINADLVKNGDGTFTLTFHGSNLKYNFQTGGCLQNEVDRNGNTISMSYNGSLQTITDTENRATTFTYASPVNSDFISQITDSASRTYQYGYDSNSNLTSYTDPNNKVTNYSYNSNLQMSQIRDPNGNVINFTYGPNYPQPLTQISYVDPSCSGGVCNTNFAYNPGAGPCTSSGIWMNTVVTDPNNHSTTYCYDNLGRILEVRDPNGHKLLRTWTSNNGLASRTDNLGNVTSLTYDANFNPQRLQSPASAPGQTAASASWGYNTATSVSGYKHLASYGIDPTTSCGAYTYDPNGNPTAGYLGQSGSCDGQTGGTVTCTAYQGDPTGTCGATATVSCTNAKSGEACWVQDGDGHRTSFTYDSNGNLLTITPPSPLGSTTLTVDSLSRVMSAVDGKGQTTRYFYDALDRTTQVLFGGATTCSSYSTCTVFNFDADGNLSGRTDATGTYGFTYDPRNLPTTKTLPSTTWNCSGQAGITLGYDNAGNLTSYCDSDGTVSYAYDSANRLTGVALPTGTCSGTPTLCTVYAYDNNDRLTSITFPGSASQNYSYNNANNLVSAVGKDSTGAVLTSFSYTYAQSTSDKSIRLSMTENDALASNLTTSYSYDSLLRLTGASNSQRTWSYGYDAAGNRTSDPSGSYQFNTADELCGPSCGAPTYTYDADGNLTAGPSGGSLAYNSQNQTTSITWSGSTLNPLAYAGLGQAERTTAGTTNYASSPLGTQILQSTSGPTYFLRSNGNLIGEETPDDNHWYYLKDGSGSVVAVINDSGSVVANRYGYDPFGKVTTSSVTVSNPWGYAGGYFDSTSLLKFGTRYYDPNLGRWTQLDPKGQGYLYTADDPINSVDPTGLFTLGVCLGGNSTIGWFLGGILNGCLVTANFQSLGFTGTAGGGFQVPPGAGAQVGFQWSNANSISQLRGAFGYLGGSVDLGPHAGADVFSNVRVTGVDVGAGVGLDVPIPVEVHGGGSWTCTLEFWNWGC